MKRRIIELTTVLPQYVDGVSLLKTAGPTTHVLFTLDQPMTDGPVERVLQVRLVIPTSKLAEIANALRRPAIGIALDDNDAVVEGATVN